MLSIKLTKETEHCLAEWAVRIELQKHFMYAKPFIKYLDEMKEKNLSPCFLSITPEKGCD